MSAVRVACVGHVDWALFARVDRLPGPGEVVRAREAWEEPGGAGAAIAAQLAALAGAAAFYTALADDAMGHATVAALAARGVEVHAAWRPPPHRRVLVHVDGAGERAITVLGPRLEPHVGDPLPWDALAAMDAVFFTAGDPGALRAARAASRLLATPRAAGALREAGVRVDALVGSARDPAEALDADLLDPRPGCVIRTDGAHGGTWRSAGGHGAWTAVAPPGPVADAYGCGDAFAAGVTHGFATGLDVPGSVALGARCGAACLTWRGPYPSPPPGPARGA